MDAYIVRTSSGDREFVPGGGHVLPHEHIAIDLRVWWEGDGEWDDLDSQFDGLTPDRLFDHRHRPQGTSRENMVLSDWYLSAKELRKAVDVGCQLLVDQTTTGLSPQPEWATKAAEVAALPIVLSVGRYIQPALSAEECEKKVGTLVKEWTTLTKLGGPHIPRGIIGEIGTSERIRVAEHTSL